MTLIGAILKKVQSKDSVNKYPSPPPEIDETILKKKRKRRVDKFAHVRPSVDSSPPLYDASRLLRKLPQWTRRANQIYSDNLRLLGDIARAHLYGGKVDSHWTVRPAENRQYYENRRNTCKLLKRQNKQIHKRILETEPRVIPTAWLERDWRRNKQEILHRARKKFVLFPICRTEVMEDPAFAAPHGINRPRVFITLRMRNASLLGTLEAELFTDVCPETCRLFLELLDGDGLGYGYVGTQFFRKVPHLFWSGGDVIYNNGFGCYAQKGRARPILAENYHFSHSMPGLLSMPTTKDEELCGIFNITFKPLPQFDLKNVVFGRIVRPCPTYDVISTLGNPLSTYPVIEIVAARRRADYH
ncbi:uncharacterized protein LOC123878638 [Maniola jurtina]|uniref:uncharacterized protein LOC123878638 n=1 Tax=Maniola jurtina TaxID=191418 RepID=UPI001E689F1D|nr:uncharacterized protein LOC123878638 [Maniola jurtina]